MRGTEGLDV